MNRAAGLTEKIRFYSFDLNYLLVMLSLSAKYLRIAITSLFSGYYKENLKSTGVVFANSSTYIFHHEFYRELK